MKRIMSQVLHARGVTMYRDLPLEYLTIALHVLSTVCYYTHVAPLKQMGYIFMEICEQPL